MFTSFKYKHDDRDDGLPHSPFNRLPAQMSERHLNLVQEYVTNDKNWEKTFTRRQVEKWFAEYNWYNPNKGNPKLDIKKGWAFYDHFTLARFNDGDPQHRHVDPNHHNNPGSLREGVMTSKIFGFFSTPASAYRQWGIGIALYFNALKVFCLALFVAGIISLPNMIYFGSTDYHSNLDFKLADQGYLLWGSAVCTSQEWVTCEADYCNLARMKNLAGGGSIRSAQPVDDTITDVFVERNQCDGGSRATIADNFATLVALLFFTLIFLLYQKKLAVRYDEDLLTASDYSIHIKNPPRDAKDPEEWRDFFLKYADGPNPHIAVCTIVLNNEELIWNLINRRVCRNELRKLLPDTPDIDDVEQFAKDVEEHIEYRDKQPASCIGFLFTYTIRPILKLINRHVPIEQLQDKIKVYEDNIKCFQEKEYGVSDVFITFETENGQRNALKILQTGKIQLKMNKLASGRNINDLFRDETVLKIGEPEDPSAMRYQDLTTTKMSKRIRYLLTLVITVGLVILGAYFVRRVREANSLFAGFLTSVLTFIIPQIVKLLLLVEKHSTEGERQRSLYLKITIFRWLLTVILVKALSDTRLTISSEDNGLIQSVRGIFISEILLIPILRLLDLGGSLSKHYFGPRARTPDQMYLCFKGTPYNLAERYTDMTKIVFLSYYFCAFYPMGLFLGSVALINRHYVDKFLLLSTWRDAPASGTKLATFSTRYFLLLAMIIAAIASAYNFAYFRYDNLCVSPQQFAQNHTNLDVTLSNGDIEVINVTSGLFVRVCNEDTCCQEQNVWQKAGFNNPMDISPTNQRKSEFRWLSEPISAQDPAYSYAYVLSTFIILITYLAHQSFRKVKKYFNALYREIYEPSGKSQNIDFTNVEGIHAYVPQIILGRFPFPLLFCNIDDIDEKLIGWTTFGAPFSDHNLIHDIKAINDSSDDTPLFCDGPLFSFIKQWDRDFDAENKVD